MDEKPLKHDDAVLERSEQLPRAMNADSWSDGMNLDGVQRN
jgi:hypothetical protein